MKRVLGLDLGTNSVGFSLIKLDEHGNLIEIIIMGQRIIPMNKEEISNFNKGVSVSATANRTRIRGARKLRERYLLRRERLHIVLNALGFLPTHYQESIDFATRFGKFKANTEVKLNYDHENKFIFMPSFNEMILDFQAKHGQDIRVPYDFTLYYLRQKALSQKISKEEMAWLLLNFNHKRGYYQFRGEEKESDKKKLEEFHTLKIVEVIQKEQGKKGHWYDVVLENGWIYRRESAIELSNWIGSDRDFIVTTEVDDNGVPVLNKDNQVKRSFRSPSPDDWGLVKIRTENLIQQSLKTPGAYIYDALLKNPSQKINGGLIAHIDRKFYKDELTKILEKQIELNPDWFNQEQLNECAEKLYSKNITHKNILKSKDFKHLLINDLIYYQRPLKSKKSEIAYCDLESSKIIIQDQITNENKEVITGPRVCSKSHPLFQELRLWQWINNLKIIDKDTDVDKTKAYLSDTTDITDLFDFLWNQKTITNKQLMDYLLKRKFPKYKKKEIDAEAKTLRWNYIFDEQSAIEKEYPCGETNHLIKSRLTKAGMATDFLNDEKLEALWHIIYSVLDKTEYEKALAKFAKKNQLDKENFTNALKNIAPFKSDYAAYSLKAIKKMLPLMRLGKHWDYNNIHPETQQRIQALISGEVHPEIKDKAREKAIKLLTESDFAGLAQWLVSYIVYDKHSENNDSSKWESPADIAQYLKTFKQHSLRNPIVEKILREALSVVQDIWTQYGNNEKDFFSEIHIELGRELKNPADKRKNITNKVLENENTNQRLRLLLSELFQDHEVQNVRPNSPYQLELLKIYEENILGNIIDKDKTKDKKDKVLTEEIDKILKAKTPTQQQINKYKLWLDQKYISPYTGRVIPFSSLFTKAYEIEHIIPKSRYYDDSLSNKVICEKSVNSLKDSLLGMEFINKHKGTVTADGFRVSTPQEYINHVNHNYAHDKHKKAKLLMEEIPEKMINRQLNDTRYVSKLVMQLLSKIVREDKNDDGFNSKNIIPVTGVITSVLKKDWGLNDVWNDLIIPRFYRLNKINATNEFIAYSDALQKEIPSVPLDISKGFQKKRIDHRHHAVDALIIALTTRNHINYVNNQNALDKTPDKEKSNDEKLKDRKDLRSLLCYKAKNKTDDNKSWVFKKPSENFTQLVKERLGIIIPSIKQNLRIINKSSNYSWRYDENGKKVRVKQSKGDNWAVRRSMHAELPYGVKSYQDGVKYSIRKSITDLAGKKDKQSVEKFINKISNKTLQEELTAHFKNNNYDVEMAFGAEGIASFNEARKTPVHKVTIVEAGEKRAQLGTNLGNNHKWVEADKGTNLFFSVYWDAKKQQRVFDPLDLKTMIEYQKQRATLDKETRANTPLVPIDHTKGQFLFTLSPNDLVYVPSIEESENPNLFDVNKLNKQQVQRIYKVVSYNKNQIFFTPANYANGIIESENGSNNTSQRMLDFGDGNVRLDGKDNPITIQTICWKLIVDRLGNISQVIK